MAVPSPQFRAVGFGIASATLCACTLRESVIPQPAHSVRTSISSHAGRSALHGLRADVQIVVRRTSNALSEPAERRVVATGQFQLRVVDSGDVTALVLAPPQHLKQERSSLPVARLFRWERVSSIMLAAGKAGASAELADGRTIQLNDPRALLGRASLDAGAKIPVTRIPEISASTVRGFLGFIARDAVAKQEVGNERIEPGAEGSSARWRTIAPGLEVITNRTFRGGYAGGSKAIEMELSVIRPQIGGGEP